MTLYKIGQDTHGSFTFYNSSEGTDSANPSEAYKGIDCSSNDYASKKCISQNSYTKVKDATLQSPTGKSETLTVYYSDGSSGSIDVITK